MPMREERRTATDRERGAGRLMGAGWLLRFHRVRTV